MSADWPAVVIEQARAPQSRLAIAAGSGVMTGCGRQAGRMVAASSSAAPVRRARRRLSARASAALTMARAAAW